MNRNALGCALATVVMLAGCDKEQATSTSPGPAAVTKKQAEPFDPARCTPREPGLLYICRENPTACACAAQRLSPEALRDPCDLGAVCGDLLSVDCDSASDGPHYYYDAQTAKVVAECGGSCFVPEGCTNCPPKEWTCSQRRIAQPEVAAEPGPLGDCHQLACGQGPRLPPICTSDEGCLAFIDAKMKMAEEMRDATDEADIYARIAAIADALAASRLLPEGSFDQAPLQIAYSSARSMEAQVFRRRESQFKELRRQKKFAEAAKLVNETTAMAPSNRAPIWAQAHRWRHQMHEAGEWPASAK